MLMVVNPGIVFTSLTKIVAGRARDQEVDARHAGAVDRAGRRAIDSRWISAATSGAEVRRDDDLRSVVQVLRPRSRRTRATERPRRAPTLQARRCRGRRTRSRAPAARRPRSTILRSNSPARSIAAVSSARVLRLRDADARAEVRRLDEHRDSRARVRSRRPRLAPRSASRAGARRGKGRPEGRRAANTTFITALSMPTADARTPAPTYGTLASSSSPWMVPSSPYGPCRTGKITSRFRPVTTACPSSRAVGARRSIERIVSSLGRATRCTSRPLRTGRAASSRACSITSAAETAVGGLSASAQRPSFSIRIGTGS